MGQHGVHKCRGLLRSPQPGAEVDVVADLDAAAARFDDGPRGELPARGRQRRRHARDVEDTRPVQVCGRERAGGHLRRRGALAVVVDPRAVRQVLAEVHAGGAGDAPDGGHVHPFGADAGEDHLAQFVIAQPARPPGGDAQPAQGDGHVGLGSRDAHLEERHVPQPTRLRGRQQHHGLSGTDDGGHGSRETMFALRGKRPSVPPCRVLPRRRGRAVATKEKRPGPRARTLHTAHGHAAVTRASSTGGPGSRYASSASPPFPVATWNGGRWLEHSIGAVTWQARASRARSRPGTAVAPRPR